MNIKVSLIVAYHNSENTIIDCVKSVLKQNFRDFELICVNNGSTDSSEEKLYQLTKDIEFVKRLSLSTKIDDNEAFSQALALVSGDFICFLESNKIYDETIVSNLFAQVFSVRNSIKNVQMEKMYRKEFLENNEIIEQVIEDKIKLQKDDIQNSFDEYKKFLKEELEKAAKLNVENVSNKNYELVCRFNQLEKNVYDNDYNVEQRIDEKLNTIKYAQEENNKQIYSDISKVYEFVGSEINKKGTELNRIYDEINGNYKYTESILRQAKEEITNYFNNENSNLKERVENLEKDLVHRYVSIKRLFDLQIDELKSKINISNSSDEVLMETDNKLVDESIEKVYFHINKMNSMFYEELTKIYKELNDKLLEKMSEQQYSFDKKLDEIRNEFNQKIEALRG